MTSKNDITGDLVKSKASNEAYLNNYDTIFRKKKEAKEHHEHSDPVPVEVPRTETVPQEPR